VARINKKWGQHNNLPISYIQAPFNPGSHSHDSNLQEDEMPCYSCKNGSIASIIRETRVSELGTMLAVTSNRSMLAVLAGSTVSEEQPECIAAEKTMHSLNK
jgi:hypothetical protein